MKRKISQEELDARLGRLGESFSTDPQFAEKVLRRLTAESFSPASPTNLRFWRYVMKGAIGMAACLLAGFVLWQWSVGTPRVAFGLDGMPDRLMAAGTVHLKGTIFPDGAPEGHPIELFIKRPGYVRLNGVPSTSRNGQSVTVEYNDLIVTPEHRLMINAEHKRAEITTETAIDAQLQAEQLLQQMLQMIFTQGGDFKKLRTETLNARQTDVYESKMTLGGMTSRFEVFLDPATGMPVKFAAYMSFKNGPEKPEVLFDTIQSDQAIPDSAFAFNVPADWEITRPKSTPGSSALVNDAAFGVRFAIALDKKTALLCWRSYDVNSPENDLTFLDNGNQKVEIQGNDGAVYHQHLLRADKTDAGYHWRWSVIWTDKPAAIWAGAIEMRLTVKGPNGDSSSANSFLPVPLPEKDLPRIVEEAQRLTLPSGDNGKPMTLQEIQSQARQ